MSGNEHARWRATMEAGAPEAVPPHELDGMLAHAELCADCGPELREFAARALTAQAPAVGMEPERAAEVRARVLAGTARQPAPPTRKRTYVDTFTGTGGWMAAAASVVVLLTHHAFHEPLRAGWMAAALFALLALGLGVYAITQRRRLEDLKHRLQSGSAEPDRAEAHRR
jgi:hypothetical protein